MSQRHYLLIKTVLRCLRGILTAIEEWAEEGRKELPSSSTLKLKR
jgi:hypothetical protein